MNGSNNLGAGFHRIYFRAAIIDVKVGFTAMPILDKNDSFCL